MKRSIKMIECTDPNILTMIEKWCKDKDWEIDDFPGLLKYIGIEPVAFYKYDDDKCSFKCATALDTVVTIKLIRSIEWSTEIWLIQDRKCLGIYYLNNKHDIDAPFIKMA